MEFKERLGELIGELKAPKNMYNSFGKYNYRNAEGILEAVKPLLKKYSMLLTLTDDIVCVGERYYVKAKAIVQDLHSTDNLTATALAREALEKKGMDDSQITGTASSYARKYALNGLFLLDDTKDADTDEYHEQTQAQQNSQTRYTKVKDNHIATIRAELERTGIGEIVILGQYGIKTLEDMSMEQFENCMRKFKATKDRT